MALFRAGLTRATERPTLIALSNVKSRSYNNIRQKCLQNSNIFNVWQQT